MDTKQGQIKRRHSSVLSYQVFFSVCVFMNILWCLFVEVRKQPKAFSSLLSLLPRGFQEARFGSQQLFLLCHLSNPEFFLFYFMFFKSFFILFCMHECFACISVHHKRMSDFQEFWMVCELPCGPRLLGGQHMPLIAGPPRQKPWVLTFCSMVGKFSLTMIRCIFHKEIEESLGPKHKEMRMFAMRILITS